MSLSVFDLVLRESVCFVLVVCVCNGLLEGSVLLIEVVG